MEQMTYEEMHYYMRGYRDGLYNVMLIKVGNLDGKCFESYYKGFMDGSFRGREKRTDDYDRWLNDKNNFLEIEGYSLAVRTNNEVEGAMFLPVETCFLEGEDKEIFEAGYNAGLNETTINFDDLANGKVRSRK